MHNLKKKQYCWLLCFCSRMKTREGFFKGNKKNLRVSWSCCKGCHRTTGLRAALFACVWYEDLWDVVVDLMPVYFTALLLYRLCPQWAHTEWGDPYSSPPQWVASSRREGWRSPCQGDGGVLGLIIAVDGGNNLSRQRARQLSITLPLVTFLLPCYMLPFSIVSAPILHSLVQISGSLQWTVIGWGIDEDKHICRCVSVNNAFNGSVNCRQCRSCTKMAELIEVCAEWQLTMRGSVLPN